MGLTAMGDGGLSLDGCAFTPSLQAAASPAHLSREPPERHTTTIMIRPASATSSQSKQPIAPCPGTCITQVHSCSKQISQSLCTAPRKTVDTEHHSTQNPPKKPRRLKDDDGSRYADVDGPPIGSVMCCRQGVALPAGRNRKRREGHRTPCICMLYAVCCMPAAYSHILCKTNPVSMFISIEQTIERMWMHGPVTRLITATTTSGSSTQGSRAS
jgi:hypothetical protein